MNRTGRHRLCLTLIIALISLWPAGAATAAGEAAAFGQPGQDSFESERTDGSYFTIKDEEGRILDLTSRVVYPGDEFIAEDNRRYLVEKVDGNDATAKLIGRERDVFSEETVPVQALPAASVPAQAKAKNLIAMYSTHSSESYVPTDGKESIPARGGIFKVGEALAQKLGTLGFQVKYDKTPHEPHDSNAYKRSRRTATQLMAGMPATIIDVHRDGVPSASFYNADLRGQPVTKVRLVVGRQNQNMQSNLDFARRIKSENDRVNPGLIRGIFLARGNYNQDLSPRSILIEAGTYTNTRDRAERGVSLFAGSLPKVLGVAAPGGGPGALKPVSTRGDWSGLIWVVVVLVLGGGLFLLISTGSFKGARDKLKNFTSTEWTNFLGRRLERRQLAKKQLPGDRNRDGRDPG